MGGSGHYLPSFAANRARSCDSRPALLPQPVEGPLHLPLRLWFHLGFYVSDTRASNVKIILYVVPWWAGGKGLPTQMFRVLTCLTGEHDLRLVALAAVICFLASFAAVSLTHRAAASSGKVRWVWTV